MKSLLFTAGALLALSLIGSSHAIAQHHGHHSSYGRGYSSPRMSVSVGYGNYGSFQSRRFRSSGFNSGFSSHLGGLGYGGYPAYGGRAHSVWHDTSHLDYHGPSLVPHRGHFDYVPGHYDVHRTGHWDTHHH